MLALAALLALFAGCAGAEGIVRAEYDAPTTRYYHGILGDAAEWGSLRMTTEGGRTVAVHLPETRVFEDTAPRLVTVNGDSVVLAVETDLRRGARVTLYGVEGLIAAGDFIGRPHRWLAPVGAGDLDGDGVTEIAIVDRPHLAKRLVLLHREGDRLVPIARLDGVTNHRVDDDYISGGLSHCGAMVLADATWSRTLAVTWNGKTFGMRELGPYAGRDSLDPRRAC